MVILLDMDGVLCDFVGGVDQLFDFKGAHTPDEYDIWDAYGVNEAKMWERINGEGNSFWKNLERFSWFDYLVDFCNLVSGSQTYLCTVPSIDPLCEPASVAGKIEWINKNFDSQYRRYAYRPS